MTGFKRQKRGASLTGYGLVVGLIAILAIVAVTDVGDAISALFGDVDTKLTEAGSGAASGGSSGTTEDSIPDAFDFADIPLAATNTTVTSETLTITGFTGSLTASISGDASALISVDGGGFVTSASITAGQTLQLSVDTGGFSTSQSMTVSVGSVNDTWNVDTVTQQPGTIDTSFVLTSGGASGKIVGADDTDVHDFEVETDGDIIVAGNFTSFGGSTRRGMARMDSDGNFDATFNGPSGFTPNPRVTALRSDEKVFAGGAFPSPEGGIILLDNNGSQNTGFNPPGTGLNEEVRDMLVLNNNQLILGGNFTAYNGAQANHVILLNTDGSRDNNFNSSAESGLQRLAGSGDNVYGFHQFADDTLLICGFFDDYNGTTVSNIVHLDLNGDFVAGFTPDTTNSAVTDIVVLSSGKILISGYFTQVGSTSIAGIARLNSDGTLDTSFNNGGAGTSGSVSPAVFNMDVQSDGKIVMGGLFDAYNGTTRRMLARLNADGSLDTNFTPGTGPTGGSQAHAVNEIKILGDGTILVGGRFQGWNDGTNVHTGQIVRLYGGG